MLRTMSLAVRLGPVEPVSGEALVCVIELWAESDAGESSLYRSQRVYSEMISWAIVAMRGILIFRPAINPTMSCGCFLLADVRDDLRVIDGWICEF